MNDRIFSCATPMKTTPSRAVNRARYGATTSSLLCAAFERHERHVLLVGELLDRGDEAIVERLEQGRRGHRMSQMVVQEVAQAAGRLELGHVGVQVQAIDAPDFERHVLTDNVGDVGRHRNLLAGSPMMVLLTEDTGQLIGPNIQTAAQRPTIRRFAGAPKEPKPRDLHHTVNGAQVFLGGLRRSFAASPWYKLLDADELTTNVVGDEPAAHGCKSRAISDRGEAASRALRSTSSVARTGQAALQAARRADSEQWRMRSPRLKPPA